MIVTFCGHSRIYDPAPVAEWLRETLRLLIEQGADTFYHGGYGDFDRLAASVVWSLKDAHPSLSSVLVQPYLDRTIPGLPCDSTLYPPLERVPRRFAILRRNEWMVLHSDAVVAYVTHGWGGAAKTLSFAERKKRRVILYPMRIV